MKKSRPKYIFETDDIISGFIFSVWLGITFYILTVPIVLDVILALLIFWLLYSWTYYKFRITDDKFVGYKGLFIFKKTHKYLLTDIVKVKLTLKSKHGRGIVFFLPDNKKQAFKLHDNPETIALFFINKNIEVETNDSKVYNFMQHYFNKRPGNIQRRLVRKVKRIANRKKR